MSCDTQVVYKQQMILIKGRNLSRKRGSMMFYDLKLTATNPRHPINKYKSFEVTLRLSAKENNPTINFTAN